MFAILKQLASRDIEIVGEGVVEVLQDGFRLFALARCQLSRRGPTIFTCLLADPSLRLEDVTVEGLIRSPKEGERYFALLKVNTINFGSAGKDSPQSPFRQSDTLYPQRRLKLEIEDPTRKDLSPRVIDIVAPIGMGQRALIVAPPRTGKDSPVAEYRAVDTT